ncbi:ComEA family DNA-binding protein [Paenibacillus physcomitrellae]|nr:helix-hairpin-helix domain-containing protein [Paenibacillus physcomitrellae]
MLKERISIAVLSAVCGAGLMLLVLGIKPSSGINGWAPVNEAMAAAVEDHGQVSSGTLVSESKKPVESAASGSAAPAGQSGTSTAGASGSTASPVSTSGASSTSADSMATATAPGTSAGLSGQEPGGMPADAAAAAASSSVISINTAGTSELQEIPGIGEKKAQAIIEYRNQQGVFSSLDELKNVKGIGDKMFEKMRPYIGL